MNTHNTLKHILCFLLLLSSSIGIAAPPSPFSVDYDAKYKNLKAKATISLAQLDNGDFLASSRIAIKLLGATVSSINESSQFTWNSEAPKPSYYEYKHTGIGGRTRSIDFDWDQSIAIATVKTEVSELPLENRVLDEISMYSFIRQKLQAGIKDIYFDVISGSVIEEYHYQVIAEEVIETPLGPFNSLRVERIRQNSERKTQLWFATNHEMLMIKLYQRDPGGDEFEITMNNAHLNGTPVSSDQNLL